MSVSYLVLKKDVQVLILSTVAANLSYLAFLRTSFLTTSINLLKSTVTGTNLSKSSLSTAVFQLAEFEV